MFYHIAPAWRGSRWSRLPIVAFLLAAPAFAPGCGADAVVDEDDIQGEESDKDFTAFESGQVRPLAMSDDGKFLYATNTPDNRLEIYRVTEEGLEPALSVPVGLEPVAVAARGSEVWVVNHLSDSVSVIDVSDVERAQVVRTLLVGDEPRDIVFAGAKRSRAFITTAHRGQNTGRDPELTKAGVGRADVWCFDAQNLGTGVGGTPLQIITLFADTPRALTVSKDGATVYAAAFHSGNRSTSLYERTISANEGMPQPRKDKEGDLQPETSLIVKFRRDASDGAMHWLDASGRRWDQHVLFNLPDKDVFAIDAAADPPAAKPNGAFAGVGTVLFDMIVNPATGKIYVANTDAQNDVRFEGHNLTGPEQGAAAGSVRGHISESRITVVDPSGAVTPRHLNKHIDYAKDGNPAEASKSLAFPMGMAISTDGATLYVAGFGSSKIGVFSTQALENDSFVPSADDQIALTGGGPSGIVLDEARGRLYAMTRFDNAISIVDPKAKREIDHVAMANPEPKRIQRGRRFLYDATLASAHGDSACASCHVFGDLDSLAWDLGNPDGKSSPMPGPFAVDPGFVAATGGTPPVFHAMKGPMATQSLRGLANHGPMHWRGDRTGGEDVPKDQSAQPDKGTFDERAAFAKFNVAFPGLLGRGAELKSEEMDAFTDFILEVMYPPNPIRNLDNSLTPEQQKGRDFFFNKTADGKELPVDRIHNCNGCHTLDPKGNEQFGVSKPGFFGTAGLYSFPSASQWMKVPHLRNMYQKVGMFGMKGSLDPAQPLRPSFLPAPFNDESHAGDQIRGFGFLHDGSTDTLFRLHSATPFAKADAFGGLPANPGGFPIITDPTNVAKATEELQANFALRQQVSAFLLAFDTNLAPIVGQSITLTATSGDKAAARETLLEARADAGECDLVVHGRVDGEQRGFLYDPSSHTFQPNHSDEDALDREAIVALTRSAPLTFMAVPPRSGKRIGLSRRTKP